MLILLLLRLLQKISPKKKKRGRPRKDSYRNPEDASLNLEDQASDSFLDSESERSNEISIIKKKVKSLTEKNEDDEVFDFALRRSSRIAGRSERGDDDDNVSTRSKDEIKSAYGRLRSESVYKNRIISSQATPERIQDDSDPTQAGKRGRGRPKKDRIDNLPRLEISKTPDNRRSRSPNLTPTNQKNKTENNSKKQFSKPKEDIDKELDSATFSQGKPSKKNLDGFDLLERFEKNDKDTDNDRILPSIPERRDSSEIRLNYQKSSNSSMEERPNHPELKKNNSDKTISSLDPVNLSNSNRILEQIFNNDSNKKPFIDQLKLEAPSDDRISPAQAEKTMEQKLIERKLSIKKYGHIQHGDVPREIVKAKKEGNFVILTVNWFPRKDGYQPLESQLTNIDLRNYDKDFLLDFYESKLNFPI